MKYAIVNNERVEAQKGMKGFCPVCNKPVIARCGEFKVNHWAHSKSAHCDKWWEAETEWHRAWKDLFPKEWQEVIAHDESGEKHVADIKTDKGFVIEFQHSHIKPEEQTSREEFYKNMIWIVDGTRLKRDFPRFLRAFNYRDFIQIPNTGIYLMKFPDEYLPKSWLSRTVPVFLDFKGINDWTDDTQDESVKRHLLWCILPITINSCAVLYPILRENAVNYLQSGGLSFDYQSIINTIQKSIKPRQQTVHYPRRRRRWYL